MTRFLAVVFALLLPGLALADLAPSPGDCDCAVADPVTGGLALAMIAVALVARRR